MISFACLCKAENLGVSSFGKTEGKLFLELHSKKPTLWNAPKT